MQRAGAGEGELIDFGAHVEAMDKVLRTERLKDDILATTSTYAPGVKKDTKAKARKQNRDDEAAAAISKIL